ncbi:hypothetical protein [Micromonospora sp. NPDC005113]
MADKRDILIRLLGEETVSRMADRAGGGLDKFGDKLDATERDAQDLDRQIAEVEGSLKTLAVAFARTGDAADRIDITKAIRRQQTELRKLTKAKDLLPDFAKAGEEAATGFGTSFVTRIIPLLKGAALGPVGATLGAVIAVPLVATLGAAVSAGILGGVAGGGIVGGVALAAKDARVQAAGKALGDAVMGDLEDSATRFVSPTIHGIGIIRSAWADVADDVDGSLAAASRYVEPLARGLGGLARELAPAFREAADAAGPVIRELSDGLPRIGSALGDLLSTAADHADDAASAVRLLVMGLEAGINVTSGLVGGLSTLYEGLVRAGSASADFAASYTGWIPVVGDKLADNRDRMHELRDALVEGGSAGGEAGTKIEGGLLKIPPAASAATVEVETLSEAIRRMAGENLTAEQANIRLEEAIDRATEAGKKNNDGIDRGTEKGRANRTALIGIAEAANASAAAIFTQTGSQELASAATEKGRAAFIKSAIAMGVSKKEAKELADKLFAIPEKVGSKVTVTANTQPALDNAKGVVARINNMHARIRVSAEPSGGYGGSAHTGDGYSTGYSQGGYVDGPGPKGVDSKPAMLAPGEGVLTSGEVDSLGGPAGFARLRAAIRGGGDSRVPAMAGAGVAGGGTAVVNHFRIEVNVPPTANPAEVGRQVVEAVRAYEQRSGKGWRS